MILAAEFAPPALIILAGPNGAGKSTLYRNELQDRYRSLEFINADELAMRHFGHAAQTAEESRMGQHLADARREALMAANQSFITESTFSHLSKLELLQQAGGGLPRVCLSRQRPEPCPVGASRRPSRLAGRAPSP